MWGSCLIQKCGRSGWPFLSLFSDAFLECPCKKKCEHLLLLMDLLFSFDIVSWNHGLGPLGLHCSVVAMDSDAG